jgi:hypothetical protein
VDQVDVLEQGRAVKCALAGPRDLQVVGLALGDVGGGFARHEKSPFEHAGAASSRIDAAATATTSVSIQGWMGHAQPAFGLAGCAM